MALRVDIAKATLEAALQMAIASHKRSLNTAKNPAFRPLYEKDIADLQTAMNTITEIK